MLPRRWSHLVRHGLLGTTLVAAGSEPAAADSCDVYADGTVAFVLGVQVSPGLRMVGGIEARRCLSHNTEALLRLELGGGSPRLIGGARARPFEREYEDSGDAEQIGVEAGAVLDMHARFGVHLAGTLGSHSAYLALQAHARISEAEQPTRWSILAGLAPWTATGVQTVEGRPLIVNGQMLRPNVVALPSANSAEERAVRDHFVASAQFEYSSVWTFMRLAAELDAVGAPFALIAAALDAADDEVRHAMLCADAAGGAALAPLPSALARPRFTARSPRALAMLAAEAWSEGCLNETAAAEEARLSSDAAGPAKAMLASIAHDEASHAELSWAVLAWVFSISPELAQSVAALPGLAAAPVAVIDPALARYGVPTLGVANAARAFAESSARSRLATLDA